MRPFRFHRRLFFLIRSESRGKVARFEPSQCAEYTQVRFDAGKIEAAGDGGEGPRRPLPSPHARVFIIEGSKRPSEVDVPDAHFDPKAWKIVAGARYLFGRGTFPSSGSFMVAARFSVVACITPLWSVKKLLLPVCHLEGRTLRM